MACKNYVESAIPPGSRTVVALPHRSGSDWRRKPDRAHARSRARFDIPPCLRPHEMLLPSITYDAPYVLTGLPKVLVAPLHMGKKNLLSHISRHRVHIRDSMQPVGMSDCAQQTRSEPRSELSKRRCGSAHMGASVQWAHSLARPQQGYGDDLWPRLDMGDNLSTRGWALSRMSNVSPVRSSPSPWVMLVRTIASVVHQTVIQGRHSQRETSTPNGSWAIFRSRGIAKCPLIHNPHLLISNSCFQLPKLRVRPRRSAPDVLMLMPDDLSGVRHGSVSFPGRGESQLLNRFHRSQAAKQSNCKSLLLACASPYVNSC